ncbi:TnsA endonuclease N-terminal domain-containing protein [Paenibacillus rigui]|uniref:TnsA endonuclease N-terminal domain-containing protein n=1 Tax=Paenibacillus rigui TaxID=554312 RepID=A0A229UVA1_9BACL|nr:TnsA endonuclease N-terminal domain-containing protein [Paenibacillus rigui]OXM87075.1 hypothetical protein CF651_07085 [Paenibacillus rigui]
MKQVARKIPVSRGKHYRWKIPFLKNGKMIHCESRLERDYVRLSDFDQHVVDLDYQPLCIPFLLKGRQRFYYPDFKVTTRDGEVRLIEVKAHSKVYKPEVQLKAIVGQLYCKQKGWQYMIVTEAQLYEDSCLQFNLGYLRALGHQPNVPTDTLQLVYDTLIHSGACTIDMLRENCPGIEDEFFYAAIYKLIYYQKVLADLITMEISDETIVSINSNHETGGEAYAI